MQIWGIILLKHCSCIVYLVTVHENYILLCVKSRTKIKIKGPNLKEECSSGTVTWWGMASSTFSREVMHHATCILQYCSSLLQSTLNDSFL